MLDLSRYIRLTTVAVASNLHFSPISAHPAFQGHPSSLVPFFLRAGSLTDPSYQNGSRASLFCVIAVTVVRATNARRAQSSTAPGRDGAFPGGTPWAFKIKKYRPLLYRLRIDQVPLGFHSGTPEAHPRLFDCHVLTPLDLICRRREKKENICNE
jgi:hypothetical protein